MKIKKIIYNLFFNKKSKKGKRKTAAKTNAKGRSYAKKSSKASKGELSLLDEYWAEKKAIAIQRSRDAIYSELASGNIEAVDMIRDDGCTEGCLSSLGNLFGCLGVIALLLAITIALCTGHIPNWLVYSIGVLFFLPSRKGIEGNVSGFMVLVPTITMIGYVIYLVFSGWHWTDMPFFVIIFGLIVAAIILFTIIGIGFFFMEFFMGAWYHYLAAIEWKYGSSKALLFVIITLGITLGGGYLLYRNGVIF